MNNEARLFLNETKTPALAGGLDGAGGSGILVAVEMTQQNSEWGSGIVTASSRLGKWNLSVMFPGNVPPGGSGI